MARIIHFLATAGPTQSAPVHRRASLIRQVSSIQSFADTSVSPSQTAAVTTGNLSQSSKLSTGAIVGIVLGIVFLLVIVALILWCVARRRKKDPHIASVSYDGPVEMM